MFSVFFITLTSMLLIIYHHVGYPVTLRLLNLIKRKIEKINPTIHPIKQSYPSITLLIPAYNEEKFIADKIRNLSIIDYPKNRLKILIVSDGSTDNTYQVAVKTLTEKECQNFPIKLINHAENRGKVQILNDTLKEITSHIVALSDVSALVSIDAFKIAVKHFNDPSVGVVNGSYQLLKPGSEGEKKYWRYQSKLKADESNIGSFIGAHGAFYLLRRHLYEPLPEDTINDDFIIPMSIVKKGYLSVFSPNIHALELEQATAQEDTQRRVRIAAGNFQQALRLKSLLLPKYKGTAFTFFFGKVLRVFMPYLLLLALLGSVVLANDQFIFKVLSVIQILIYSVYGLNKINIIRLQSKFSKTIRYVINGHVSSLMGVIYYLWQR